MTSLSSSLLAQTIDDHIVWMEQFARAACFKSVRAIEVTEPDSFALWRAEATKSLHDQPALAKLIELYDQMHRMARLVLLKGPESPVIASDYDSVAVKYREFILGLRRLERALATAASGLDPLTGMRSRTGMMEDLTRELSRFQRNGKPFCIALMDIDHFKKVNDTYGHDNGDRVLSAAANHLSRSLRPFDDAWRWGGEEFLVCLKEADQAAGILALERVRASLEKLPIKLGDGNAINITASFGIVAVTPDATADSLIEQADKALYRAKTQGRNRIETSY
jgi:diguanylate cyclase